MIRRSLSLPGKWPVPLAQRSSLVGQTRSLQGETLPFKGSPLPCEGGPPPRQGRTRSLTGRPPSLEGNGSPRQGWALPYDGRTSSLRGKAPSLTGNGAIPKRGMFALRGKAVSPSVKGCSSLKEGWSCSDPPVFNQLNHLEAPSVGETLSLAVCAPPELGFQRSADVGLAHQGEFCHREQVVRRLEAVKNAKEGGGCQKVQRIIGVDPKLAQHIVRETVEGFAESE